MDIKHLKTFVKVVQKGSLSEAAHALHFTQPAVSKHLQLLEKVYNAKLIERNGKSLIVTEQGKVLFKYALEVLNTLEKAENAIIDLDDDIRGELHLAASTIPGQYILPHLIGDYKKKFSEVRLSLEVCDSNQVQKMILNREVDMGVIGAEPKNKRISCFEFLPDQLTLVVSPTHPLAKSPVIRLEELMDTFLISRKEGSATKQVVEERLKSANINYESLNNVMELGNTESVKTAVEAGLGVAFISKWAIQKELKLGSLLSRKVEGLSLDRNLYAVFLEHKTQSKAMGSFLSYLKENKLKSLNL